MIVNLSTFFSPFITFWSSDFFLYCLLVIVPCVVVAIAIKFLRGLLDV